MNCCIIVYIYFVIIFISSLGYSAPIKNTLMTHQYRFNFLRTSKRTNERMSERSIDDYMPACVCSVRYSVVLHWMKSNKLDSDNGLDDNIALANNKQKWLFPFRSKAIFQLISNSNENGRCWWWRGARFYQMRQTDRQTKRERKRFIRI